MTRKENQLKKRKKKTWEKNQQLKERRKYISDEQEKFKRVTHAHTHTQIKMNK